MPGLTVLPPPFASTRPVAVRPLMEPPRVYVLAEQVTVTVTVLAGIAPLLLPPGVQVRPVGWVCTVSAYWLP